MAAMDDVAFLHELEPVAEQLLARHLTASKEWFPHQLVPWSRGRDFQDDEVWDASETGLSDEVRSSLFVNLLTEDNLPYYTNTILGMFGQDSVWGEWARRWTAEENRHSIVIRDYLTVTRALDPVELERARMRQMSGGQVPQPPDVAAGFAYVAMQELATRVAHRNTGKLIDDPAGYAVMSRVANDENLHYLFYRDMVQAGLELDPSRMVVAIEHEVHHFEMPGTGIPDFTAHAMAIARAGIYDFAVHHDAVLVPTVVRQWKIDQLEGLNAEAEQARDKLMTRMRRIEKAGRRFASRRDAELASAST
jgi:acyl-[acyl-carrier-protein] desaturase